MNLLSQIKRQTERERERKRKKERERERERENASHFCKQEAGVIMIMSISSEAQDGHDSKHPLQTSCRPRQNSQDSSGEGKGAGRNIDV